MEQFQPLKAVLPHISILPTGKSNEWVRKPEKLRRGEEQNIKLYKIKIVVFVV